MTSPFDWRGTPSQVVIPDYRSRAHKVHATSRLKIVPGYTRQVAKCDLDGNVLKVYPSCVSAARDNDISPQNLHNCLRGKSKTAGGFMWKDHVAAMHPKPVPETP
jgi:hypothetical protein